MKRKNFADTFQYTSSRALQSLGRVKSSQYRVTFALKCYAIVEKIENDVVVGMKRFEIGDVAEYDSYNLSYYGRITAIGQKTITITDHDNVKRLKPHEFAWRNWNFSLEETEQRNNEISLHI